jgi:hypothetical protein
VRRFGRGYLWTVLALLIVALGSRIYTTNSLAGEPTSDEYLYAVHARDLARGWAAGQSVSLEDLGVEGRSVAVESAALSFVLPWDPLTVGRTMQAFFNALCVPTTFVLGRQIGLTRSAAFVGASSRRMPGASGRTARPRSCAWSTCRRSSRLSVDLPSCLESSAWRAWACCS